MSLTRRCVTDPADIDALQAAWDRLLLDSTTGSPFCSHAWCVSWWKALGTRWRPEIYTWERDGRLVGLLPLMRRKRLGVLRELRFMSGLAPEQLDVLALNEARDDLATDLTSLLDDLRKTCDLFRFADLAPDGVLLEALSRAAAQHDTHPILLPSPPQAGVLIQGTFDEYFAGRGQRLRRNFRRSCRELHKQLDASPRSIQPTTPTDAVAAFDSLWRLHAESFARRGEVDYFESGKIAEFHRAVVPRLASLGLVWFVTVAGPSRVLASTYCLVHRDRLYCYQLGFDPSLEKLSPGFVTIGTAIQLAFERGCAYFDFLRGDEFYKHRWANASHHTVLLAQSMNTVAGGIHHAAAGLVEGLKKMKRSVRRE